MAKVLLLSRLAGPSIIYMVSFGLSRGLPVLLLPIYLRYLTPTGFGYLAIAEVITSLSRVLLSQGLDTSVFHHYFSFDDEIERRHFIGSIWSYSLVSGILIAVPAIWMGERIHGWLQWSVPFHPYFSASIITALLRSAFELYALQILRAKENAIGYALISITSLTFTGASQITFLILLRMGSEGIVWGNLIGSLSVAFLSLPFLLRQVVIGFSFKNVRQGLSYSLPLIPHLLGHWLSNLSDRLILERFVPVSSIGIYSVGDRFRQGYAIIPWGLNSALMPAFGKARRNRDARSQLPRIISYYALAIAWIAIALISAAPIILRAIAPESFGNVESLIPWLVMAGMAYGLYFIPMNLLAQTVGRTREVSIATLASGILNILLNLVTIPHYGITAAAVNTLISSCILLFGMYLLASKFSPMQYEYARLGKIIVSTAAALLLSYWLSMIQMGIYMSAMLTICAYPIFLMLLRFPTSNERRELLRFLRG